MRLPMCLVCYFLTVFVYSEGINLGKLDTEKHENLSISYLGKGFRIDSYLDSDNYSAYIPSSGLVIDSINGKATEYQASVANNRWVWFYRKLTFVFKDSTKTLSVFDKEDNMEAKINTDYISSIEENESGESFVIGRRNSGLVTVFDSCIRKLTSFSAFGRYTIRAFLENGNIYAIGCEDSDEKKILAKKFTTSGNLLSSKLYQPAPDPYRLRAIFDSKSKVVVVQDLKGDVAIYDFENTREKFIPNLGFPIQIVEDNILYGIQGIEGQLFLMKYVLSSGDLKKELLARVPDYSADDDVAVFAKGKDLYYSLHEFER